MRRISGRKVSDYRIAVIDDEAGIVDSVCVVLNGIGYNTIGFTAPQKAIQKIRSQHFDLIILDFLMKEMNGDKVVEEIRKFNKDTYILLLTGHRDLAPPMESLKRLDIQGYCEKSDKFDQLILLVESGLKSVEQMRTIKKFKDGLTKILETVPKIYKLAPITNILDEILKGIMHIIESKHAFILVDDMNSLSRSEDKSVFRGIGKYDVDVNKFFDMLDPKLIEGIGYTRTNNTILKLEEGTIFPFISETNKNIGALFVESSFDENYYDLLKVYSNHASASITNAFLHSLVNIKNDELSKTYEELKVRYMDTIEVLRLAVDAKDVYIRGHSDRVSYYAVQLGIEFGLSDEEIETLRLAGIFHDIGKIGTSDDLLFKTDSLNSTEYTEIKKHPLKGAYILSAVSMFKDVVPVVRYHHEWVDGNGYPDKIKGEEIPLLARILSVADAFDAITTNRTNRVNISIEAAKTQLMQSSGTQFDSSVVQKFLNKLETNQQFRNKVEHFCEVK